MLQVQNSIEMLIMRRRHLTKVKKFFDMLNVMKKSLWKTDFMNETNIKCDKHIILSAVTQCLTLKLEYQLSYKYFDGMMALIKNMLMKYEKLLKNFH